MSKVDATTDADLERLVAADEDERGLVPDWTRAELVLPQAKQSVHLRLEQEIISYFKSQGKGHISRMQAVLKAYVEAHREQTK
ncbi:MAG: BrnA antitoxin family protein [Desulfobaccales bacterium]